MPQLQEHQLKVAGVASLIVSNIPHLSRLNLNPEEIITACLLHDMGNLAKFDLSKARALITHDLNLGFWRKRQGEHIAKYGQDAHAATLAIVKEIGVSQRVFELIDCIGFLKAPQHLSGRDYGKMIVQYSDDRVAPQGVVSLEQRLKDLRERYEHHKTSSVARDRFENALREIEKQIFRHCKIRPEEITEKRVKQKLKKLRNWEI